MCWDILRWAKDVAFYPKKNTKKDYKYKEFVKRLAIISLIPGILLTVLALVTSDKISMVIMIPIFLLSAVISPVINGGVAHFFGKILFRIMKKDYKKTYNAYAYAAVPGFLFGWIPFVGGFVGGIWSIVVGVYALSNQQKISTGRALLVALIPMILILAFAFGMLLTVFSSLDLSELSKLGY